MISVREGDITTYDGDAIVNAANNHLRLGAGVAGAIARAGGPAIQQACDRHGPVRVGEAAITEAGALPVAWVIHAAAMGDEPVTARSIRDSTAASLVLAASHGITRIAFPVLGTGIGGFPFTEAARIMFDVVRATPHGPFTEIVFYGFGAARVDELHALLAEMR